MTTFSRFPVIASFIGFLLWSLVGAASAQTSPVFLFEPMLDTYFDDQSGLIVFHASGYDLAFPPDEPLNALIAVVDDTDTVVESFPFRSKYTNRTENGAFARAMLDGTAEITLTEPGVYNVVYIIDGKLVSRLPVVLERLEIGDDPFERETVYRYYGLWELYAHITNDTWKGENWPKLTFWAGIRDFNERTHQLRFFAELKRDGEVVAHSKRTSGSIPYKHYQRVEANLYYPHEQKLAHNAIPFAESEWTRDGDYEITITRKPDGALLRKFHFIAHDGKIQPLPETLPDHQPAIDYRVPRVIKKGSSGYEFAEAVWIKSNNRPR
jgi:hypothetical protein